MCYNKYVSACMYVFSQTLSFPSVTECEGVTKAWVETEGKEGLV